MRLQDIYENLKHDLETIESMLAWAVQTDHATLSQSAGHLLKAGGKRIRPVFVLLAGQFGNYDIERLKRVAVPLELIHMATLVHDDVIDDAETRRGHPTVKAKWDNRIAMYTGDYIFARSLTIAAEIADPRIHRTLSQSIVQICEGEIEQIRYFYNWNQSLLRYLQRIRRKTALLMAVSCELGGLVSQADKSIVRSLRLFGYYVGMAFQLTDDVLDLVGEEETLGKPAGSDLRQGNVTLPVIYALHHATADESGIIVDYLRSKGAHVSIEEVIRCVRNSGGISYTMGLAYRYLDKALQKLEELPANEARESLRMIAQFIGSRSY